MVIASIAANLVSMKSTVLTIVYVVVALMLILGLVNFYVMQ
jgi:hypothetical protein